MGEAKVVSWLIELVANNGLSARTMGAESRMILRA
jgi:hypothetical protein